MNQRMIGWMRECCERMVSRLCCTCSVQHWFGSWAILIWWISAHIHSVRHANVCKRQQKKTSLRTKTACCCNDCKCLESCNGWKKHRHQPPNNHQQPTTPTPQLTKITLQRNVTLKHDLAGTVTTKGFFPLSFYFYSLRCTLWYWYGRNLLVVAARTCSCTAHILEQMNRYIRSKNLVAAQGYIPPTVCPVTHCQYTPTSFVLRGFPNPTSRFLW